MLQVVNGDKSRAIILYCNGQHCQASRNFSGELVAAGFTGGQAEELRRAFGFKRSEKRMADIEVKLREGMTANGIIGETQDTIVHSITSFALYGWKTLELYRK